MKRVLIIGLVALILLTSIFLCAQFSKDEEQIPFDVDGWNGPMIDASTGVFTGTRLKMVDDLLKRYDFHGWHIQDVKALLGEPSYDDNYKGKRLLVEYDLRDGLKLLIFEVDEQMTVVDYYTYIDD